MAMTAPTSSIESAFIFITDQNSLLRGLNAFSGPIRGPLRTVRVDRDGSLFSASAFFNFLRFGMIARNDNPSFIQESRAVSYDESEDKATFLRFLTGDPKESLFIREELDAKEYLGKISKAEEGMFRAQNRSQYKDLLSAILDSYQVNFGVIFLLHDKGNLTLLNRIMIPARSGDEDSFEFYTKVFLIHDPTNNPLKPSTNFVQVHRRDLSIIGSNKTSSLDMSQMILPVVHLKV